MIDPFDDPDITILTNDGDASMAIWEMANADRDAGNDTYQIAEKMQKSITVDRVHEIWVVLNDALQSGALIAGIYGALKAVEGLSSKRLSIHFGARVKVSRDDQDRLQSLGCEIVFEKADETLTLPGTDD